MQEKMYSDEILQKPKTLKKVKRLKHKSARHQEKNLDAFYLINENVRTAREISSTICSSLPSDHDINMKDNVGYTKYHDTLVQQDNHDDNNSNNIELLNSIQRSSPSPFIECTLITTPPTEEVFQHDGNTDVQITTRVTETAATVMTRIVCSEHSETTSLLILSTDSLSLTGIELQNDGDIDDNGADSSIVLDTSDEYEEEVLLITDDSLTISITPHDSEKVSILKGKEVTKLNTKSEDLLCEVPSSPEIVLVPPIVGIPLQKNEKPLPHHILESFHQRLSQPQSKKEGGKSFPLPAEKPPSPRRSLHPSRSYERYVQEGRAKRQLQEELAEQQRQEELQEIRFTPQVSSYAAQRVSRSVSEYINASQEWEERRQAHVRAAAARLENAAREQQASSVKVNPTSRRMVVEMMAQKRRVSVVEGVQQHAAVRELQEKYTPTFQPSITPAAKRQKRGDKYNRLYTKGKEKKKTTTQHPEEKYQPKKRTEAAIREHVEAMLARDAARRARSQKKAENIRKDEEEKMRVGKPQVNPHSVELAERHRQRQRIKEEEIAAAVAAKAKTKTKSTSASQNNPQQQQQQQQQQQRGGEEEEEVHKSNFSPEIKIQQGDQQQQQKTNPTNRKLAYSSSGTRADSRMRSSCGPKQQQQQQQKHTMTPLLSPEFEERNSRLLQQRQHRAESRRRELEEEFTQTCTFRPQTNPVSRRMASAHYSHMEPSFHYMRRPSAASTSANANANAPPPFWTSDNPEDDFEWAEYVRRAKFSVERSDSASRGWSNARQGHDDLNYHYGNNNTNNNKNNRNDDDNNNDDGDNLASQIESLEAMLEQWKQLEAEFRIR